METWKSIPGFADRYEVSSEGRIRSLSFNRTGRPGFLKPNHGKRGQLHVTLWDEGRAHQARISRLMLETFIGPAPLGKPLACHKDDNPRHNVLTNLRWGSSLDNARDRSINGKTVRGEATPNSTLSVALVLEIRRRHSAGESISGIARAIRRERKTVSLAARGVTWAHVPLNHAAHP